eukprot:scaffold940_cov262-Pinguiococcus_pyrenoidosus.AAC.11
MFVATRARETCVASIDCPLAYCKQQSFCVSRQLPLSQELRPSPSACARRRCLIAWRTASRARREAATICRLVCAPCSSAESALGCGVRPVVSNRLLHRGQSPWPRHRSSAMQFAWKR